MEFILNEVEGWRVFCFFFGACPELAEGVKKQK